MPAEALAKPVAHARKKKPGACSYPTYAMNDPCDPNTLELLDQYLAQLQAGLRPDRAALLDEHPELASALTCLEMLEGMASLPLEDTPHPSIAAELPRDFGPYQLLAKVGRGGMGVVYKARQKELDRTVAVKMILASHLASPEHIRRFQSEARAAARLRHSHIVPIHEVGQLHGQHYFTMEYIEGESLAERIARGPIQYADGRAVARCRRPGGRTSASTRHRASRPEALQYSAGQRRRAIRD